MRVELVDHDPRWAELFAEQRDRASSVLAPWLAAPVEHVGSTAVCGLRATPVVDVLALVDPLADRAEMVGLLAADGWLHWPDDPWGSGRLWLLRPRPELRTHHLQVVGDQDPRARALLLFRDGLREDHTLAAEYQQLKERLARTFPDDRNAYTNGKAQFVAGVLRAAGLPDTVRAGLPECQKD